MPVTDEDLVAAIAAGDREAFGALYHRRRPDVYRFAMHMIGVAGAALVCDLRKAWHHENAACLADLGTGTPFPNPPDRDIISTYES